MPSPAIPLSQSSSPSLKASPCRSNKVYITQEAWDVTHKLLAHPFHSNFMLTMQTCTAQAAMQGNPQAPLPPFPSNFMILFPMQHAWCFPPHCSVCQALDLTPAFSCFHTFKEVISITYTRTPFFLNINIKVTFFCQGLI